MLKRMEIPCEFCGGRPCRCVPDERVHEPATCPDVECAHCVGWSGGYDAGKHKAHAEIRLGSWQGHSVGCGCEPCITARAVLSELVPAVDLTVPLWPRQKRR